MQRFIIIALLTIAIALTGCGEMIDTISSDDDDRHLAQGFTACGDFLAPPGEKVICNPSQYCADPTFSECRMGCLSEFNCEEGYQCNKGSDSDIGTCQREW